jgi:hypothetical protein
MDILEGVQAWRLKPIFMFGDNGSSKSTSQDAEANHLRIIQKIRVAF